MSLVERIDAYGGPAVRWPPYPMGRNVYPLGLRSQAHNARLLRIRLGRYAHVMFRPGYYPLPYPPGQ